MDKKIHHGRNVKRFREMLGIKQEALAADLGEEWTQKKISLLEGKEEIEPGLLEHVARVLNVSPDAIKNFDDDAAINYFNTFSDNAVNNGAIYAFNSTFNPIEKWIDALDENKKLYERLLQAEREKIEILQKLLDKK